MEKSVAVQHTRILWIDFAKAVGIWLVVLGHMQIQTEYRSIIYSFHMPLFFFLSGYLDKNKSIKETFLQGIKTLIVPYFLLYIITYLWWFFVSLLRHPEIYGTVSWDNALRKPLLGLFLGVGYDTTISTMVNVPLWFLIGLFYTKMLHSILIAICKNNIWLYLSGISLMVCGVYALQKANIDVYFSIDSALLAMPFFGIGNIVSRKYPLNMIKPLGKTLPALSVCIFCFLMLALAVPENGRIDVNGTSFGENIVLFYLIGFLGILAIMIVSLCYSKESKILTIISNGTIIILAFHGIAAGIIYRLLGLRGEGIVIHPIIAVIVSIAVVMVFIPPILFVKKYIPIIMGGRK